MSSIELTGSHLETAIEWRAKISKLIAGVAEIPKVESDDD